MAVNHDKLFDPAVPRDFMGEDADRVERFLADFTAAATRLATDMRRAAGEGDLDTLASLAHRLKSSARWVGAIPLGTACQGLERAGRGGDAKAVAELLEEFATVHDQTLAAIADHLASQTLKGHRP